MQPVCSPTRAEFLTGRWHPRGGVHGVSTGAERLDLDERTVAEAFQKAGYATGCFGKWHNGSQYPYHPNARGFQEYYGFLSGHWGEYFDPPARPQRPGRARQRISARRPHRPRHRLCHRGGRAGKPFFCYVAFNTPHSPMQVPGPVLGTVRTEAVEAHRDERERRPHPGRARDVREHRRQRRPVAGRTSGAANRPRHHRRLLQRQRPQRTAVERRHERHEGKRRRGRGPVPAARALAGSSAGGHGRHAGGGRRGPVPDPCRPGRHRAHGREAIRRDQPRPLAARQGRRRPRSRPFPALGRPHQRARPALPSRRYRSTLRHGRGPSADKNIAADHSQVAKRLNEAVARWKRDVLGELPPVDDRPFTVGFAAFPRTVLPARDGVPTAA